MWRWKDGHMSIISFSGRKANERIYSQKVRFLLISEVCVFPKMPFSVNFLLTFVL